MQRGRKVLALALVAGGALALLHFRPGGERPVIDRPDDVRACVERMRACHDALVAYVREHGALPAAGLRAALAAAPGLDGPLSCPAGTGYAVRDLAAHPLPRFPSDGSEPLLACDAADGRPHGGAINILFADRSVRTIVIEREVEAGRLPPETTGVRAGPDSPLPLLRKLRVD